NLSHRKTVWAAPAHEGFVRGVVCDPTGEHVFSCGQDKRVKLWRVHPPADETVVPVTTFLGAAPFACIDHHGAEAMFATASAQVDLWDPQRSEPVHSFSWGVDTINALRFNQVETNILASTGSD